MVEISSNNIRVKQLNVELVKNALIKEEYGTKLSIARQTGLSVATCGNILKELLESGEVFEIDYEQPKGGRPARRFVFNTNYHYIACVYLSNEKGVSSLTYAVVNMLSDKIEEESTVVDSIDIDLIARTIQKILEKYENIQVLGLGIPGAVNNGTVVGDCDIKSLCELNLKELLEEKFPYIDIIIENDMNLKTLGFYKKQNYNSEKNIAVINFPEDNCIGAGILINGKIVRGDTSFAGEVSYLPFGISREEQKNLLLTEDGFIAIVVKTITSIVAILNPEAIVLTGDLIDVGMLSMILAECGNVIPQEHIPQITIRKNLHDDYIYGLFTMTMQSLSCEVQLVSKKI